MINRRKFLSTTTSAGAVTFAGGAGLLSVLGNTAANAATTDGYKAIVCLFFLGGQDCHDVILPYDQPSYDKYAGFRSGILTDYAGHPGGSSRSRENILEINPLNASAFGSRRFALPATLSPIKQLFDTGKAAIIGNVGPLIEPLNAEELRSEQKVSPKRLFSHNDQQSTWMASAPEGEIKGWGGKMADAILASNPSQEEIFTAISTSGNSVFLSGDQAKSYVLDTAGPQQVEGLKNADSNLLLSASGNSTAVRLLEEHYRDIGANRSNLFEKDLAKITDSAFSANEKFSQALSGALPFSTAFPANSVGQQLRAVAEAINLRGSLNMSRQVFFVGMGGFDTHDNQAASLTKLQTSYAEAVASFYDATVEMGIENDVTLFTAADFGRALLENGNGTDHGWGGHHFVVGGSVKGNTIYGDIPPHDLGHDYDAGNGRLIPQYSVEQYAATLGKWLGLSESELLAALPALANFSEKDLGFMASSVT